MSNGSSELASAALTDSSVVSGAVVLATCNRYEVYGETANGADLEAARSALVSQISELSGLNEQIRLPLLCSHHGPDVTRHLFAVSAGLNLAVVGEREIAGQVRRALIAGQAGRAASSAWCVSSGGVKDRQGCRRADHLGSRGLSIVSVALDLATDLAENDDWTTKKVVVFGTAAPDAGGNMWRLLRERGCTDVSVYSSSGRAEGLVATRGGTALDDDTLPAAVGAADVMIGCSGSDNRVEAADLARVRANSGKPLIAIDLALTHDFDPAVGELDGVELLTLESVRLAAPPGTGRVTLAGQRNRQRRCQRHWSPNAKPVPWTPPSWRSAVTP